MRKSTILIYNVAVILFFLFCALLLGAGLFEWTSPAGTGG